jgi:hypothetical protein
MLKLKEPAVPKFPNPPEEPHIASDGPSSSGRLSGISCELEEAKRDTREFMVGGKTR